jgi:hypothetical protein
MPERRVSVVSAEDKQLTIIARKTAHALVAGSHAKWRRRDTIQLLPVALHGGSANPGPRSIERYAELNGRSPRTNPLCQEFLSAMDQWRDVSDRQAPQEGIDG